MKPRVVKSERSWFSRGPTRDEGRFVLAVATCADGHLAIASFKSFRGSGGSVEVWETRERRLRYTIPCAYSPSALSLSSDGTHLLIAGELGVNFAAKLELWALGRGSATLAREWPLSGHISSAQLHPDLGRALVVSMIGTHLVSWSGADRATVHERHPLLASLAPEGDRLMLEGYSIGPIWPKVPGGDTTYYAEIRSLEEPETTAFQVKAPRSEADKIVRVHLGSRSIFGLSGRASGAADAWNIVERRHVALSSPHSSSITGLALPNGGPIALSTSKDGTLKAWDVETGECRATHRCEGPVACAAASDEGLVVVGIDGIGKSCKWAYLSLRDPRMLEWIH